MIINNGGRSICLGKRCGNGHIAAKYVHRTMGAKRRNHAFPSSVKRYVPHCTSPLGRQVHEGKTNVRNLRRISRNSRLKGSKFRHKNGRVRIPSQCLLVTLGMWCFPVPLRSLECLISTPYFGNNGEWYCLAWWNDTTSKPVHVHLYLYPECSSGIMLTSSADVADSMLNALHC